MSKHTNVVMTGRYASISVALSTILFAVSLVIGIAARSSFGPLMGYVVCIVLAASVVVVMASFYLRTEGEGKIFALLALVAAVLYAPFCMGNYYVQLSTVAANPLNHPAEVLKLITFVPGSMAFALDMFGYALLCLSTLAAAFALKDPRDKGLRVLCLVHGALAIPTVAAPIMSAVYRSSNGTSNDAGSWVLLFWCALFTPIAILFYRSFRSEGVAKVASGASS